MSLSSSLFRLQQIDSQLDQAHARLQTIDAILQDNTTLTQAQAQTQATAEALQQCRQELRQAEDAVRAQRAKIEQTESTLYGGRVHNPKELQDLQNDAQALKRHLSTLEDLQLEAMLALEEAEAHHQSALAALSAVQAQLAEQHASLKGERSTLCKAIERLEIERQAALSAISSADLTTYDTLRRQRHGIAVAKVTNKSCNACGAVLSASTFQLASSPSQLVRCPTCGRILYVG